MTAGVVVGVDCGDTSVTDADGLVRRLVSALGRPDGMIGCTHFVRDGHPHVACSLLVPEDHALDVITALGTDQATGVAVVDGYESGPAELVVGATLAATEHAARSGGRAVVYPGTGKLTGTMTVAAVLAASAIERVTVLPDRSAAGPDRLVVTRGHIRPQWSNGRLTLITTPAAGKTLIPFEIPDPTPCCGG